MGPTLLFKGSSGHRRRTGLLADFFSPGMLFPPTSGSGRNPELRLSAWLTLTSGSDSVGGSVSSRNRRPVAGIPSGFQPRDSLGSDLPFASRSIRRCVARARSSPFPLAVASLSGNGRAAFVELLQNPSVQLWVALRPPLRQPRFGNRPVALARFDRFRSPGHWCRTTDLSQVDSCRGFSVALARFDYLPVAPATES